MVDAPALSSSSVHLVDVQIAAHKRSVKCGKEIK